MSAAPFPHKHLLGIEGLSASDFNLILDEAEPWLAFNRGTTLPPISVVDVGDGYAVRDGHHRVSVAKALGALTIRAVVAA